MNFLLYLCSEFNIAIMKKFTILSLFVGVGIALGLSSCNVIRTISTQSSYVQHGDTTTTIVTKTIESYDASKK